MRICVSVDGGFGAGFIRLGSFVCFRRWLFGGLCLLVSFKGFLSFI
jgi:hypothetical protein